MNGNFFIPTAQHPTKGASFRQISPPDAEGKPIWTVKEAAHLGYSGFVPGEAERIESARVEQEKKDVGRMIEQAANDAWSERKVVIRD